MPQYSQQWVSCDNTSRTSATRFLPWLPHLQKHATFLTPSSNWTQFESVKTNLPSNQKPATHTFFHQNNIVPFPANFVTSVKLPISVTLQAKSGTASSCKGNRPGRGRASWFAPPVPGPGRLRASGPSGRCTRTAGSGRPRAAPREPSCCRPRGHQIRPSLGRNTWKKGPMPGISYRSMGNMGEKWRKLVIFPWSEASEGCHLHQERNFRQRNRLYPRQSMRWKHQPEVWELTGRWWHWTSKHQNMLSKWMIECNNLAIWCSIFNHFNLPRGE